MYFSVVIPAYNAERFIKRSIYSVINQSFTDFEVIVINDGSKDNTSECAKSIDDKRVIVIDKRNEGVSVARNTGIEKAKGEYICFLDADDEYLPEHLSTLYNAITVYKDKSFFFTRFCVSKMDNTNDIVSPNVSGNTYYYGNVVEEINKTSKLFNTGCVCIKKEMFYKYGMFEPGVKLREDTDMWRRVYVHTGAVFIDVVSVKCNRDGSEATKKYTRIFDVDPMNRFPGFFSDKSISNEVKDSLKTEVELTKLQVVRSNLIVGDKKTARQQMMSIDKSRIPRKKLLVTQVCFLIPSFVIRSILRYINRGMYE